MHESICSLCVSGVVDEVTSSWSLHHSLDPEVSRVDRVSKDEPEQSDRSVGLSRTPQDRQGQARFRLQGGPVSAKGKVIKSKLKRGAGKENHQSRHGFCVRIAF